jgi:hypothetical protein
MSDFNSAKACPRLIDYLCVVGNREAVIKSGQKLSSLVLKPQLLKRYPAEDHKVREKTLALNGTRGFVPDFIE